MGRVATNFLLQGGLVDPPRKLPSGKSLRFVEGQATFPAICLAGTHVSRSNQEADDRNHKQMETHEWTVSEGEAQATWTLVSERISAESVGDSLHPPPRRRVMGNGKTALLKIPCAYYWYLAEGPWAKTYRLYL